MEEGFWSVRKIGRSFSLGKISSMPLKRHNIFISHHSADDPQVQALKNRLVSQGYNVYNYSIDSKKYQDRRPSDAAITRLLRMQIRRSQTVVVLLGPDTANRKWVNYEIRQAHRQRKRIIGVYRHGLKDKVELPSPLRKYGSGNFGWNSVERIGKAISGESLPNETPEGGVAEPAYSIMRIKCNTTSISSITTMAWLPIHLEVTVPWLFVSGHFVEILIWKKAIGSSGLGVEI